MKHTYFFLAFLTCISISCNPDSRKQTPANEDNEAYNLWLQSYKVFELETIDKNYALGAIAFDSLLGKCSIEDVPVLVLKSGINCWYQRQRYLKIKSFFHSSSEKVQATICESYSNDSIFQNTVGICQSYTKNEAISHPAIRKELEVIYLNDQACRGGKEFIASFRNDLVYVKNPYQELYYNMDEPVAGLCIQADVMNREKLKKIITLHGFPTLAMVGKIGMEAVFLTIQHADADTLFRAEQLEHLKKAVNQGDIDKSRFAYLMDRILVKRGKHQLYGTQCEDVNFETKEVTLYPVAESSQLNKRRLEMGLMPIEIYKRFMVMPLF